MSNSIQNSNQKQLVIVLSRFGFILAVYNKFDDAEIFIKDTLAKGQTIDMSVKYVQ